MKVILSRKGVDSKYGGYPITLNPDCFYSIPIPDNKENDFEYKNLNVKGENLLEKIYKCKKCKLNNNDYTKCHLDPLIFPFDNIKDEYEKTKKEFIGTFGQCGVAQSHLCKNNVGVNDIFLFYGWFEYYAEKNKKNYNINVIWGYLQIDKIIHLNKENSKEWQQRFPYQPHCIYDNYKNVSNNNLYIAKKWFNDDEKNNIKGFGLFDFKKANENGLANNPLVLTSTEDYNTKRTNWRIKDIGEISLKNKQIGLSWNKDRIIDSNGCFTASPIGQEFIFQKNDNIIPKPDCKKSEKCQNYKNCKQVATCKNKDIKEVSDWAIELIKKYHRN